eukprot:3612435-Rhodomonas_salina.1
MAQCIRTAAERDRIALLQCGILCAVGMTGGSPRPSLCSRACQGRTETVFPARSGRSSSTGQE